LPSQQWISSSGAANPTGIYEADLLVGNDEPIVGFQLDGISYDETPLFKCPYRLSSPK
jgi:hypothetical protein